MTESEVFFTSLCFIEENYEGRVWLHRLADIEDDELHIPFKSNRLDNRFENRDRWYQYSSQYWDNGPSAIGTVGVWSWSAIPKPDNPEVDRIQSYYVDKFCPVRIVALKAKSLEEIVEQLKAGSIYTQAYFCDTLFCYEPKDGQLSGVLCRANEFQISDKHAALADNVYYLPHYTVQASNVYNWDDRNLRFLKALHMDEPTGYISIRSADEIIRALILERSTWSLFKESIGATKAEWRNSKTLIERICNESLYEEIVERIKCTPEQAKQAISAFIERSSSLIDAGDIDADVLAQIALHHDELRLQSEEAVSKKWQETHAVEIAKAEQQLADIEIAVSSSEEKRKELLSEIATAQSKRDQLLAEIEQYEALGRDTLAAVRQKISEAQKDMAGFIANLSVFLPQSSATPASSGKGTFWKYTGAPEDLFSNDDVDLAENWNNEFDAISQNLSHSLSIVPEMSTMLAAFLYAAHINNVPLLIAGPAGCDMAQVLSVSLYANGAGKLTLGDERDNDITEIIEGCNEQIVSIQNMFGKGWGDVLPQAFSSLKKHIVWTHPYIEDMVIEPKSLYNYMLPLLSECFVGAIPALDPWPGKRIENFNSYIPQKQLPLRISAFKRLGLSNLITNQLERVLSDAKAILDNPVKDKDLEILFGLLPFSVLTGRTDVLKEAIETENGISSSVKAEVSRYIEEV